MFIKNYAALAHAFTCQAHCLQHNWTRVDNTVMKELYRTFGNTVNRR